MKSIQTKFIILILSCVLLCSTLIGGGAIMNAGKATGQNSSKIMNLQSRESAEKFNNLLSRIEQSVKTLSVFALEQMDDVEQFKTDKFYMEEYTKRIESVAVNAANNTEGAMAVYIRYNPEFTPPTSGLFWSKTNLNDIFKNWNLLTFPAIAQQM